MRMTCFRRRRGTPSQAGITMIELMIAGVIMVVGFLGMMVLIMTAIATNNRNKMDTNATLVAQMVMEEIKSNIATGSSPTLTDCGGTAWTIGIPATSGGAALSGGNIDFSIDPPANYFMNFRVCTANGGQATYDVRWNVQLLPGSTTTWLVTVGSRPRGATSDLRYFALPVTLRGYAGT